MDITVNTKELISALETRVAEGEKTKLDAVEKALSKMKKGGKLTWGEYNAAADVMSDNYNGYVTDTIVKSLKKMLDQAKEHTLDTIVVKDSEFRIAFPDKEVPKQ